MQVMNPAQTFLHFQQVLVLSGGSTLREWMPDGMHSASVTFQLAISKITADHYGVAQFAWYTVAFA